MKALTVRQPYANFIAEGVKTVEVRSRKTNHRGPLLIHAGATIAPEWREECLAADVDLGCLYVVADVIDCRPFLPADCEAAMMADDDFKPGLFAWVLANPREIGLIDYKGQQGMFNVPDDLIKYF